MNTVRDLPWLDRLGGYVAGRWVTDLAAGASAVVNPATLEPLARLPNLGPRETAAAIEAADQACREGAPPAERRRWLEAIHDGLQASKDSFARLITLENGKPLPEAVAEVEYTCGFFQFFANHLDRLEPERLPGRMRGCEWTVVHRPAGVAALISPWNFPLAMLGKKLAPALGAGCGVVIKPAPQTPLSLIALCRLAEHAGVPPGWLNLVLGPAPPIGEMLCTHPAVRILSFTGSTATGRWLAAHAGPHLKRLTLELGGNAPFVVFEDAELESAVAALVANKFRAAGQTCVCANRVLVQESVAARFIAALAERVAGLRVGNGLDPSTDIGPLIHCTAWEKVNALVHDALARGAQRLVGERPLPAGLGPGAFYPPTLLTDITPDMRLWNEEIFGPVIAIRTFASETEAVTEANRTHCGLAAYVFSRDSQRLDRVAPRLRFGHVGLNTGAGPTPEAPFGGFGDSGFGREGGLEGLLEYCESQVLATAGSAPPNASVR